MTVAELVIRQLVIFLQEMRTSESVKTARSAKDSNVNQTVGSRIRKTVYEIVYETKSELSLIGPFIESGAVLYNNQSKLPLCCLVKGFCGDWYL